MTTSWWSRWVDTGVIEGGAGSGLWLKARVTPDDARSNKAHKQETALKHLQIFLFFLDTQVPSTTSILRRH
jgi:hypothetical protein